MRRGSHSSDEIRASPESLDGVGRSFLEVLVGASEFLIAHDDPFSEVLGFQNVANAVVRRDLAAPVQA